VTAVTWRHLLVPAGRYRDAPTALANTDGSTVVIAYDAVDPAMMAAAQPELWDRQFLIWMPASVAYRASLIARAVKTLSWLVPLSGVVVSSDDGAEAEHAAIIATLLSGDDVSIETSVGVLQHAWNRPLPPRELSVCFAVGPPGSDEVTITHVAGPWADASAAVATSRLLTLA